MSARSGASRLACGPARIRSFAAMRERGMLRPGAHQRDGLHGFVVLHDDAREADDLRPRGGQDSARWREDACRAPVSVARACRAPADALVAARARVSGYAGQDRLQQVGGVVCHGDLLFEGPCGGGEHRSDAGHAASADTPSLSLCSSSERRQQRAARSLPRKMSARNSITSAIHTSDIPTTRCAVSSPTRPCGAQRFVSRPPRRAALLRTRTGSSAFFISPSPIVCAPAERRTASRTRRDAAADRGDQRQHPGQRWRGNMHQSCVGSARFAHHPLLAAPVPRSRTQFCPAARRAVRCRPPSCGRAW
jgi:hypothetical protein